MKKIPLTQGKFALVNDEDYESLQKYKWHAHRQRRRIYAMTNIRGMEGKRTKRPMHRLLLPSAEQVDHMNGNGLDNRRENLRAATQQENSRGFRQQKIATTSKFRGVCWRKDTRKWSSYIWVSGKRIHLGLFEDEKDAARAYNDAAQKFFGGFTSLSLILPPRRPGQ